MKMTIKELVQLLYNYESKKPKHNMPFHMRIFSDGSGSVRDTYEKVWIEFNSIDGLINELKEET